MSHAFNNDQQRKSRKKEQIGWLRGIVALVLRGPFRETSIPKEELGEYGLNLDYFVCIRD